MESVYWVFTLRCNDTCEHCYNSSGPRGETLATAELLKVVPNLPARPGRIILSGGEPTVELDKLAALCGALRERYGPSLPLFLQSNGDLLDEARLARILAMGIDRIDIASIDRHHKQQGRHEARLRALFESAGMRDARAPRVGEGEAPAGGKLFAFWGATEELWLKGNWARGRALGHGLAKLDPEHNFCALWSGALGFLTDGHAQQEVHVQLSRLYPCCPTTYFALGDVREARVDDLLARYRGERDWQALDRGRPHELGADPAHATARIRALGDVCLWCDEYFRTAYSGPRGEARAGEHRTRFDV